MLATQSQNLICVATLVIIALKGFSCSAYHVVGLLMFLSICILVLKKVGMYNISIQEHIAAIRSDPNSSFIDGPVYVS